MNKGDKVRFIDFDGCGTVVHIDGDRVVVEDEWGMQCEYRCCDVVCVGDSEEESERMTQTVTNKAVKRNAIHPDSGVGRGRDAGGAGTKKTRVIEVDLHDEAVMRRADKSMGSAIHERQLRRIREVLAMYASVPGTVIVFIHGKGEGVLRRELVEMLDARADRFEWTTASEHKYGLMAAIKVKVRLL